MVFVITMGKLRLSLCSVHFVRVFNWESFISDIPTRNELLSYAACASLKQNDMTSCKADTDYIIMIHITQ